MSLFFNQDTAPSQLLPEQGPPGPPGPPGPAGAAGASTWDEITGKPTSFSPSAHKTSHATGGSDALAPADIGAATAAQGAKADTALQGNAPCIVDINSTSTALRVTQSGSGNAIVVEDSTHPDSTPFRVDQYGCTFLINAAESNDPSLTVERTAGVNLPAIYTKSATQGLKVESGDGSVVISRNDASASNRSEIHFLKQSFASALWGLGVDRNSTGGNEFQIHDRTGVDGNPVRLQINDGNEGIGTLYRQWQVEAASTGTAFAINQSGAGDALAISGNVTINGNLVASATATAITSAAAPITAGSVGSAGSIRYDADYIYICTATNTWRRTAVTSW